MNGITPADWSYTEYARLPGSIKDNEQGLQEAAKQFESLFINMWLKSAREANAVMSENSPFASNELEMQQQMFDSQMAMHLAKEGGIGLAPTIVRQLRGGVNPAPQAHVGNEQANLNIAPTTQLNLSDADTAQQTVAAVPSASRISLFESPEAFVEKIGPYVKKIIGAAGLPPLAVMAQAALETGWGKSVIAKEDGQAAHNLFGIKATNWDGEAVDVHSKEYLFGQWQNKLSSFRAYSDWQAGIADYAAMVSSSQRYNPESAKVDDPQGFADQLQQGGYATDPGYAAKLKSIMQRLPSLGF